MTGQKTEVPPCNLCGCTLARMLYPSLNIVQCTDCGLVRSGNVPGPERLRQTYSESYFRSIDSGSFGYDDYIADRPKIRRTFQRRLQEIEKWAGHKGRLLDVGCATGFAVEVAAERQWQACGIEISQFASGYARQNLRLDVRCGTLEQAQLEPESFDVVTMWDYIEHCIDPSRELALVNKILKPGGLVALTTPNIASVPARLWGPRWMGIKDGEHLYYFSPSTVRRLLADSGFELVRLEHVGKFIDIGFFIKRTGLYSTSIQRFLSAAARLLHLDNRVLYVNPFDIMLVYGKKMGGAR